jgi:DNA mismatch repair protein MutS
MNKEKTFQTTENINRDTMTPVMRQYLENKEQHPGAVLFFRLGDFYEMFYEDALRISKILDLTLTKKNFGKENDNAPMCGVPYHSVEGYIKKLIDAGEKVAICEQVEDAALAKGLVKRDVVQIVTPGTVFDQELLVPGENNYLCSIYCKDNTCGLAYADVSTGELFAMELQSDNILEEILNAFAKIKPKELVSSEDAFAYGFVEKIEQATGVAVSTFGENIALSQAKREVLERQTAESFEDLEIYDTSLIVPACYMIYRYLQGIYLKSDIHLSDIKLMSFDDKLILDDNAIRNLELFTTLGENKEHGSLISVINRTKTSMGKRLLRRWLASPLVDIEEITSRQGAVEKIIDLPMEMDVLKDKMSQIQDILRYTSKLAYGKARPRDLIALSNSLQVLPEITSLLLPLGGRLGKLAGGIADFSNFVSKVFSAFVDEPPLAIKDGGFIREGYNKILDDLKASIGGNVEYIKTLEQKERDRTDIRSLKVKFNRVSGYYIELSKANSTNIPEDYMLKQTLTDKERYITPQLKKIESELLGAEAKIATLEQSLLEDLLIELAVWTVSLKQAGEAVAELDVLLSFAILSVDMSFVRPKVSDGPKIEIISGRHPVIEVFSDAKYIPNDLYIDGKEASLLLITGPNMAGKSTYMRQSAIIIILAQMGCFVPAKSAHIGICDRIFTRIGASDNIHKGESTFFVEMNELANILNNATGKSFIILDEIGRGTSTYDGLAIAWATVEKLTVGGLRVRTMLATHYHELTTLEGEYEGIVNLRTSIINNGGKLVFMHKVLKGATGKSYGVQVAKLSGVPAEVISSAEEKLKYLGKEKSKLAALLNKEDDGQISFFDLRYGQDFLEEQADSKPLLDDVSAVLAGVDLMNLTPAQAIDIIGTLKELVENNGKE